MKKILLVHDAELFLRMEQTILRRRDYQIYKARTGEEALSTAVDKHPDLVILDDGLDDPCTLTVCRAIRTNPVTANCSILVAVSRQNRGRIDEFLKAGANDYVVKPSSRLLFNQRVTNLLHVSSRRFLRTLLKAQVEGRHGGCSFFGSTINLSEGGVLIETRRNLDKGERIGLQFFLPGDPRPVFLGAEVTRTGREMSMDANAYGLAFTEISDEDRERLRGFVQERTGQLEHPANEYAPGPRAVDSPAS